MIRLGARSGYEIKRDVEQSIRFFWTISQAQIYPALEELERRALIRGHDEPTGNRPRRVYDITEEGQATLRAWLSQSQSMPFELRDIGLVKLFFADALDAADAEDLLGVIRQRSEERVTQLEAIEPRATAERNAGNVYPLLTLRMGIAYHRAMIEVCDEFSQMARTG